MEKCLQTLAKVSSPQEAAPRVHKHFTHTHGIDFSDEANNEGIKPSILKYTSVVNTSKHTISKHDFKKKSLSCDEDMLECDFFLFSPTHTQKFWLN